MRHVRRCGLIYRAAGAEKHLWQDIRIAGRPPVSEEASLFSASGLGGLLQLPFIPHLFGVDPPVVLLCRGG